MLLFNGLQLCHHTKNPVCYNPYPEKNLFSWRPRPRVSAEGWLHGKSRYDCVICGWPLYSVLALPVNPMSLPGLASWNPIKKRRTNEGKHRFAVWLAWQKTIQRMFGDGRRSGWKKECQLFPRCHQQTSSGMDDPDRWQKPGEKIASKSCQVQYKYARHIHYMAR